MSAEQAAAARVAIQRANQLKADCSPMERALIEAALVRYPEDYDPPSVALSTRRSQMPWQGSMRNTQTITTSQQFML